MVSKRFMRATLLVFQSPICRGRRCNRWRPFGLRSQPWFQSPISRGRRCNIQTAEQAVGIIRFQSPICRGRRCNSSSSPLTESRCGSRFSPLFVGAGVAIAGDFVPVFHTQRAVSVPYLSGQALQYSSGRIAIEPCSVSVPYLSGQALQWHKTGVNSTFCPNFVSTFCQGARQPTA